jgi:hypothetical protein
MRCGRLVVYCVDRHQALLRLGGGVTPKRYHPARRACIGSLPSATSTAVFRRSAAMAGLSEIADYARVGQDRNERQQPPKGALRLV